jgi:hypothetical protein
MLQHVSGRRAHGSGALVYALFFKKIENNFKNSQKKWRAGDAGRIFQGLETPENHPISESVVAQMGAT